MWPGVLALLGIAFGALVGVPAVPCYLAAGAVWGLGAFPWVMLALLVHFLLSYFLARSFFRPLIEKILKKFSDKLQIPDENSLGPRRLVLLVRLFPGVPLFVKSYFLGICAVPLGIYLLYSLLTEALWVLGFIIFGHAALKGQWPLMAVGLLLVLLMAVISRRKVRHD